MIRLRYLNKFPPGGFTYEQSQGISYSFPAEGGLKQLTTRVHEFRTANKLERSDWESCFNDIEQFNAARLVGTDWVEDSDAPLVLPPTRQKGGGGCCGARIT